MDRLALRRRSVRRYKLRAAVLGFAFLHSNFFQIADVRSGEFVYDQPTKAGVKSLPELSSAVQPTDSLEASSTVILSTDQSVGMTTPVELVKPADDGPKIPPQQPTLQVQQSEDSARAQRYVSTNVLEVLPQSAPVAPPSMTINVDPWWNKKIQEPIRTDGVSPRSVGLDELIWITISNSPQVKSLLTTPQIREAEINEASAIFDRTRFVESIFHDTSDPVGNLLTTGGAPRLKEHYLENKAGVRARNRFGGQAEFAQELGLRDNNSQFFVPKQQAESRMVVRYTHPLRKGAGTFYNYSSIAIAQVAAGVSHAETNRQIQDHVFNVCKNYWTVFYNRAVLLQGQEALGRLSTVAANIAARAEIDGTHSQAARAKAAVANQQARVQRAAAELLKSEVQLESLVGAPDLQIATTELIPTELPLNEKLENDISFEMAVALEKRPELIALRDQIRGTRIQQQVAENELRPTLNLVTEAYVRGLNGDYGVTDSLGDQFARGRPSYNAGLTYQRPRSNIAANAIMRQRSLEMRQLLFDLDQQLLYVSAEVASAAAELEASFAEYAASVESTIATNEELNYLADRWKSNPFVENSNTALLLDEILDAESRLNQAENSWALAQSNYMIAIAKAKLVAGSLLSIEEVSVMTNSNAKETSSDVNSPTVDASVAPSYDEPPAGAMPEAAPVQ